MLAAADPHNSQGETSLASKTRSSGTKWEKWPKQALALFAVIIIAIYALIFLTGDRSATPKLGIDLQGGTRVTLVPQGTEPTQEQLNQARTILENRVNGMGVSGATVIADGDTLVITVPGEDTSQARAVGQTSQLFFRPMIYPSSVDTNAVVTELEKMANRWIEIGALTPEEAKTKLDLATESLKAQAEQLKAQAEQAGTEAPDTTIPEFKITAQPPKEAANSIEAAEMRDNLLETLKADRQSTELAVQIAAGNLLVCDERPDPLLGTDDPALPLVACDETSGQAMLLDAVPVLIGQDPADPQAKRLTGNEIDTSRPITGGMNPQTGQMEITFSFKSENGEQGGATWAQLTTANVGQQVAITLDSKVISAPEIQSPTPAGSTTAITGSFTQEEATELANNLRYGALPLSFAGENGEQGGTTTTVPASLGVASLKAGLIAGLVGFALVALFSLYFYRYYGVISLFSLVLSGVLVYGSLVLLGRIIGYSLDLAGIAGLIIGIGTTADSFVVIYERIKDEIRAGRTFRSAVPHAWERARSTIVTGNMVTLIAAVVVYLIAVGEVKGFAFTLGLTTVFDLLVTFLLTAPLIIMASRQAWTAKPAFNGLGKVFDLAKRTGATHRSVSRHATGATTATVAASEDSDVSATDASEATSDTKSSAASDENSPVESVEDRLARTHAHLITEGAGATTTDGDESPVADPTDVDSADTDQSKEGEK